MRNPQDPSPNQGEDPAAPHTSHRTAHRATGAVNEMPRLLAFYQDVVDEGLGSLVGWRTVAWGLAFADGAVVSVPAGQPVAATIWQSLDDAAEGLDAYVDTPDPRSRTDLNPSRASTATSPGPLDGTAARPACPNDPVHAAEGRDRPPGDESEALVESGSASGSES